MSQLIQINTAQVKGAIFNSKSDREISVAKNEKAKVVMTGFIGAGEIKEGNDYKPTAFGRLPVEAALAGKGESQRLVLQVAGGLRGVLFKAADGKEFDYNGNLEDGNGNEYPLFGRKVKGEQGVFISLSSMDKKKADQRGGNSQSKPQSGYGGGLDDMSDDVPF